MSELEAREGRGGGVAAAARTHPGKVRTANQDTFVCKPEQGLLAVIDGMGGSRAGEVAAGLTRDVLLARPIATGGLAEALERANREVYERASANPEEEGMGCVVTAARVDGTELEFAHVGDTRAFLASAAGCEQLTRDHTLVADIQEAQGLVESETERLPGRHQVTRDVGRSLHDDASWIDVFRAQFEVGDLLLLCSDGLSDLVSDGEVFDLLGRARSDGRPVDRLADQLIETALARGAHDNVTVVVARRERPGRERGAGREARPPSEVSTEKVPVLPAAGERSRASRRWPAALGLGGLCLGLGLLLGSLWPLEWAGRPAGSAARAPQVADGMLDAAARGTRLVAGGSGGLDGRFAADVSATALGPWQISRERTVSRLDPRVVVELRAPRILFDAPRPVWRIELSAGSRMEIRQASIRAPELILEIVFEGPAGVLRIEDSHLELGGLAVRGSEDGFFEVLGGALELPAGALEVAGPRVSGTVFGGRPTGAAPSPGGAAEAGTPASGESP